MPGARDASDELASFDPRGTAFLDVEPASAAELEGVAGTSATALVQKAQPTGRPGEWTFGTQGSNFAARWRVSITPEQERNDDRECIKPIC
ncbi:hypothetical protein AB0J83_37895 [Actinoplanes sp. NPDC049596]|uniref:hypothetical protein n=1 Tax=unclassified Actinoplanes TaxID=2626549 RepID=UPI003412C876